ncbi:flavin reductase [Streptomyces sp. AC495_CC817]|uniref:flavin reductase n=1 Tax=Streptomyces sp. AC495_CC817 TaxID=2823900 RepID=UPI0020B69707|nr:flavin reductase [Streptomyces sp. AC495_CC817]
MSPVQGRRIAIVGAGEAGAQLALGLQAAGHTVTLVSDRTADDIREGQILSSQCVFGSALAVQHPLGELVDAASADVLIDGISVHVHGTGDAWSAPLDRSALSVDQRVKVSAWITAFADRGGDLRVQRAGVRELEALAASHDLVVVGTGKGELSQIFATDRSRSPFDRPQRVSAVTYVRRPDDDADDRSSIRLHIVPGVGEFFTFPGLTTGGPCQMMVFEGVPGGPMDRWADVETPEEHLARSLELLRDNFPEEAARFEGAELADEGAVLRGRVSPIVRHPVGVLPSGARVLGLGDAVILNDPVTGQGSNNATIAARHLLEAIERHGGEAFDEEWMRRTFEEYWRAWAQWSTAWTNGLLGGLTPLQQSLMSRAGELPALAAAIVGGFDDPRTLFPWWTDEKNAEDFVRTKEAEERAAFDTRDLRTALGQFATGVTVITSLTPDGKRIGVTANSFTSVSMDPPLVLWCPGKHLMSLSHFEQATHFAINVLASDQYALSRQFASAASDKFQDVAVTEGIAGVPVLDGAIATFECRTVARHDAGDHVVYIGEIERYGYRPDAPLVFHGGAYRDTATHRSVTA